MKDLYVRLGILIAISPFIHHVLEYEIYFVQIFASPGINQYSKIILVGTKMLVSKSSTLVLQQVKNLLNCMDL